MFYFLLALTGALAKGMFILLVLCIGLAILVRIGETVFRVATWILDKWGED